MSSPQTTRRVVRVSHLSFLVALGVMMAGPFTAAQIVEATGLHQDTVYRLLRAMCRMELAHKCGTAPDSLGRNGIPIYKLGAAESNPQ